MQKYKAPREKYIVQDGGTALMLPADLSTIQLQEAMKPYQRYKVRHAQGWAVHCSTNEVSKRC